MVTFDRHKANPVEARRNAAAPVFSVLAYLKDPERGSMHFERLAQQHQGVKVAVASSLSEADDWLEQTDLLITIGSHLGEDASTIFRRAKKLQWVQSFGTGVDNIKGHPELPAGVVVTNVHGIHGHQVSEAAFAGMLSFARHLPEVIHNQDQSRWEKPQSTLLHGKSVGILGLGAIANELAPRCKAFGMRLTGITGTRRDVAGFERIFSTEDIEQAVSGLDYLVLLTPLTAATHHIINAKVLAAMRPNAVLVNLSRGGVVDEDALLNALDSGQIAGAALDVFEREPLPANSPFWNHPKVLVTSHAAGFHTGYPDQAFAVVSQNVTRFLEGGAAALMNKV